jgi:carbonic anhydrase/acetyltransferase-like protein (isoleucine patch superfamily)
MNAAASPRQPSLDPGSWVAPSAQLFGAVSIGADASIWHNAVLRAECQNIRVGRMTNIQDFAMVHVGFDEPTAIGEFCSVTHHATVHGCAIGDHCLIGIGAVIMDGAVIGPGSIVAGGAFVTEGKIFPANSIIAGVPARVIRERDSSRANRLNAWLYHRNAQFTSRGDHDAWHGPEFEAWREAKREQVEADRDL